MTKPETEPLFAVKALNDAGHASTYKALRKQLALMFFTNVAQSTISNRVGPLESIGLLEVRREKFAGAVLNHVYITARGKEVLKNVRLSAKSQ